ncbi:hypothetical protein SPRG_14921 [Saprolegnia parasitica CBS 223.65]|uniref:Uncharacterized protein n=1 Tax=Saprolegnia parasitica (strain CBS 223.65) TaxID=695850 RepID=A0A067BPU0_SAPPC|nr:hypothetical protein SPRG_14921 [Saprolegnia parasitica CBS 223.65]KDO18785.1 hypothetical protein SPRG_14921 [Saprolegnia parasitica CBS 223.65]|eukprot:XP_012210507.1 hypothetical protein SPRG_14921 [Saprolegnia parasitica CBS 223.65]
MASFPNRARWLVLAAAIAAGRATAACTGMLNQVGATWCVACEPAHCVPMRHTMDVIVTPAPTPLVTSSNASTSITASVTSFGAFKDVDPANDVKNLKISASASGLSTFGLESIANVKGLVSLTLESLTLGPGTVADALPLTTLYDSKRRAGLMCVD